MLVLSADLYLLLGVKSISDLLMACEAEGTLALAMVTVYAVYKGRSPP